MSDRLFFSLMAVTVIAMVALALVFPQGQGKRSPGPFGHAVEVPAVKTPAATPAPIMTDAPKAATK